MIWKNLLAALFPLILCVVTRVGIWWYVVITRFRRPPWPSRSARPAVSARGGTAPAPRAGSRGRGAGSAARLTKHSAGRAEGVQQVGTPDLLKEGGAAPVEAGPPQEFFTYFWIVVAANALLLLWYYRKMEAESFELLKLLSSSVMPLGILTIVVLAVILFGITTATESAAIGAAGAFILALQARTFDWERLKQSVFLTAKTTAMVCWLFIGSALFSGVFAILGGQQLVETWVLSLNMTPIQFTSCRRRSSSCSAGRRTLRDHVIFVPIFRRCRTSTLT